MGKLPSEGKLRTLLEAGPREFAVLASELSDRLIRVETQLNDLPSKTEASVLKKTDNGVLQRLGFVRAPGSRWNLVFSERESANGPFSLPKPLRECSVSQKVDACTLLEDLIGQIAEKQSEKLGQLHEGLETLQRVENLLGMSADRRICEPKPSLVDGLSQESTAPTPDIVIVSKRIRLEKEGW
ncbi:MAG: hypothetical protein U0638_16560 [Phycisphaerales bacterium]